MERRKNVGGKCAALVVLMASALIAGQPNGASAQLAEPSSHLVIHGKKIPLVKSNDLLAIQYDPSLPSVDARRAAEADASDLDLEVVEDQIGMHQLIVKTTPDELRRALRSRSDISGRIVNIRPVYFYNGISHPDYMVTIPDRMVVALQKEAGVDERNELFARYGLGNPEKIMDNVFRVTVPVINEEIAPLAVKILEENPELVRYAEPSVEMKIKLQASTALPAGDSTVNPTAKSGRDPLIGEQWHLHNSGRNTLAPNYGVSDNDTDAPRAWNPNTRGQTRGDARTYGYFGHNGSRPVVVAVFDTGTDLKHKDFSRNVNDPFQSGNTATSVMSMSDDYDYFANDTDPTAGNLDIDAHGTAVAAIIGAARNNGVGGSGVAPEVSIMTQRIGSAFGFASFDRIAGAIVDAANRGADISNHSWGTSGDLNVMEDATEYAFYSGRLSKGMAQFASSANNDNFMEYPSLYPWTFSVGGTDDNGNRPSYASWGGRLDFVGYTQGDGRAGIVTSDISGSAGAVQSDATSVLNPDGDYWFDFNGTSAASPVVAGVAALIMAEYPNIVIPPAVDGSDSLFDLMVRYADRPGDPWNYVPAQSNVSRLEMRFGESADESVRGPLYVLRPQGFRYYMGYKTDGFNQFQGYGAPNPFNVITRQRAKGSFNDHLELPGLIDELTTQGIRLDFGEMVLVYESNFNKEYREMFEECKIELFGDEEGNLPEGFEPDPGEILEIRDCILTKDGEWDMTGPVARGDNTVGPKETHFYETQGNDPIIIEHFGNVDPQGELNNPFPVVIHSNRPPNQADDNDFWYNPRGRYFPNSSYTVSANIDDTNSIPLGEFAETNVPLFMDITMKYELATWNGSRAANTLSVEYDKITIRANGRTVASLDGESTNAPIPPLFPATELDEQTKEAIWPFYWIPGEWFYEDFKADPEFRTFRFYIGRAESDSVSVSVSMTTGASYLPEWGPIKEDGTREQLDDIKRDHRGFQIGNIKIWAADTEPDENTFLTAEQIADPDAILQSDIGTRPVWTPSGNDVLFVDIDRQIPDLESTVYTVGGDSFTRRVSDNDDSVLVVERRERIPIFRTCMTTPADIDNCTPANIISLDSDTKQARLLYVAESSSTEPRMYIVTEDGFDEYPVIPFDAQTDDQPIDRFVKSATFARATNSVFYTDGEGIYAVEIGTKNPEYIIDTASIKLNPSLDVLQDIRDIATDESDFLVFFSALNRTTGDYNLYYTIRNLNLPGQPATYFPVLEWDSSHEVHPRLSADGKRLVFASNTIDQGNGAIPPAGAPAKLYLIDNVLDLALYPGTSPNVKVVDLERDTRLARIGQNEYTSALFPSFHPSGNYLTFVGYPAQISNNRGEIATVRINPRDIQTPTLPSPYNPGPPAALYPAPDAEPFEHVTHMSQNLFNISNDGWEFLGIDRMNKPVFESQTGLFLRANNDNENTYGFFISPQNSFQLFAYPEITQTSATPFAERQGPHYLLRFYVRRTTEDVTKTPIFRMRVNSSTLEDYHTLVATSTGSNASVPGMQSTAMDMLFQPSPYMYNLPRNQQTYYMSFDLINTDTDDDRNGGFYLDRMDLFRVPLAAIEEMGSVKQFTFDQQSETDQWTSYSFPGKFTEPVFSVGSSQLEMATSDPEFTFGQWQNLPGTVGLNPTGFEGTVFVRMTATAGADETNPLKVPEMRFRVARDDWSISTDHGVVGMSTGTFIPTATQDRVFRSYMKVPTDLSFLGLHGSWDILSFETFGSDTQRQAEATSPSKIYLKDVKFDLIRINGYPAADPNP